MQRYNCDVNVGGDIATTVEKEGVSAAEVLVLRAIHGADSVRNIKRTSMDKGSHADERARLDAIYGGARVKLDGDVKKPVMLLLFGPPGVGGKLPVELEGDFPVANVLEGEDDKKGRKAAA